MVRSVSATNAVQIVTSRMSALTMPAMNASWGWSATTPVASTRAHSRVVSSLTATHVSATVRTNNRTPTSRLASRCANSERAGAAS